MSLVALIRMIRSTGRIAEPAPAPPEGLPGRPAALAGSVQVRHVDAGSCNGCEVEIGGAFGPVYDAERYGARLVASPRHADVVLVTGVVTHNMSEPLRHEARSSQHRELLRQVAGLDHDLLQQLVHRMVALGQELEDADPGRVAQRSEQLGLGLVERYDHRSLASSQCVIFAHDNLFMSRYRASAVGQAPHPR